MKFMSTNEDLLGLVADIVSAHVSNNNVATAEVPGLIRATYAAMASLGEPQAPEPAEKPEPAVSARKSLSNPNHILSMIDGKPYTMLKRHLAQNGLTPAEYRERFDLPADYPMTAKAYSERRRELAHSFGLGRKKAEPVAPPAKPERKPRAKKAAPEVEQPAED
jgi:predicted transcriptional regulator